MNFTLVVDDFGISYINKNDADRLISALQEKYEVTQDRTGGPILRNNTEMGLQIKTTRNINDRLRDRIQDSIWNNISVWLD